MTGADGDLDAHFIAEQPAGETQRIAHAIGEVIEKIAVAQDAPALIASAASPSLESVLKRCDLPLTVAFLQPNRLFQFRAQRRLDAGRIEQHRLHGAQQHSAVIRFLLRFDPEARREERLNFADPPAPLPLELLR